MVQVSLLNGFYIRHLISSFVDLHFAIFVTKQICIPPIYGIEGYYYFVLTETGSRRHFRPPLLISVNS